MIKNKKLCQNILYNDCLKISNKGIISSLCENGDLDSFFPKINIKAKVNIISKTIYGKNIVNGGELFLLNLGYFISNINNRLVVPLHIYEVITSECLKSEYSIVLFSNIYMHKDDKTLQFYCDEFDKMIVDRFLKNLRYMYPVIKNQLKNFNVNIMNLNLTTKRNVDLLLDLLNAVLITNYDNLTYLASVIFRDVNVYNKSQKGLLFSTIPSTIIILWEEAFKNLTTKFSYINKVYKFKALKYIKKSSR